MTREEAIDILQNTSFFGRTMDDIDTAIDMAIKALEQEPKTGYISIDDVMSVFDDFMCGEVDEEGTEIFLEMLKDKAETE